MDSTWDLEPGGVAVSVEFNDNSDEGRAQEFFETEEAAQARADEIRKEGPQGNADHPAPDDLDLRAFRIERLVSEGEWETE